jgi:ABC-type bacteriocin/lantibiotic exporter with double-glycine peptidase domain
MCAAARDFPENKGDDGGRVLRLTLTKPCSTQARATVTPFRAFLHFTRHEHVCYDTLATAARTLGVAAMRDFYRYIWKVSGKHQVFLSLLAVALFVVQLAPLELQRRIINHATERAEYSAIAMLCLVYLLAVLVQGGLKYALNMYRGSISETANQRLRLEVNPAAKADVAAGSRSQDEGVALSIIVSEVEAVGGFIGSSFSEPVLNGGILLSIFGYMLFTQPLLAVVAIALFCPQFLFIPLLQDAINKRTESRIKTMRGLSSDIVNEAAERAGVREEKTFRRRVRQIYRLNMEIFYRKFGMSFLINLFHHLGTIGILAVGGWLLLQGRTEMGTIVAFISGINRMNDPWGDLVNFFRDLTNAGVKFRLIVETIGDPGTGAAPPAA